MRIFDKPQHPGATFPAPLVNSQRRKPDSEPSARQDRFEEALRPDQDSGLGDTLKAVALLGLAVCGTATFTASQPESGPSVGLFMGQAERVGNRIYYPDGTWKERVGDTVYSSDGTKSQRVGDTVYSSDGTKSQRVGNTVYRSDGVRSERVGNRIYSTDGTWEERVGDTLYRSDGTKVPFNEHDLGIEHNLWKD